MLGHQAIETAFHLPGKRIVRGALIGEFGMSADWRDRPCVKQRCPRRQPLERAIGVPQPVAQLEQAESAFLAPHLVVVIEVGNVGKFLAQTQQRILSINGDRGLERAEMPREVEMLILREMLIGKDQDRVCNIATAAPDPWPYARCPESLVRARPAGVATVGRTASSSLTCLTVAVWRKPQVIAMPARSTPALVWVGCMPVSP